MSDEHPILKERACQQSLYLEPEVYERLRVIAFHERTKLHALLLEGVNLVLAKRGSPPITNPGADCASPDPRQFNLVKAAYTVQEACDVLGIRTSKLYGVVREGRLHPRKDGKLTLFLAADLAHYLASLPEKPPSGYLNEAHNNQPRRANSVTASTLLLHLPRKYAFDGK